MINAKKYNEPEKGEKPLQHLRYCKIDWNVATHWLKPGRRHLGMKSSQETLIILIAKFL